MCMLIFRPKKVLLVREQQGFGLPVENHAAIKCLFLLHTQANGSSFTQVSALISTDTMPFTFQHNDSVWYLPKSQCYYSKCRNRDL